MWKSLASLLFVSSLCGFAQMVPLQDNRPVIVWEKRVPPTYPQLAKEKGVEGTVSLKVQFDPDGSVQDVKVLSGDDLLASAAVDAVKQWKARPTLGNGAPLPTMTEVPVTFHLKPPPAPKPIMSPDAVLLSQLEAESRLVAQVRPVYPSDAKMTHIQGSVVVRILVGTDGKVKAIKLMSGHPMLAPAALDSVKGWKYKPFEVDGQMKEFEANVTINFALAGR